MRHASCVMRHASLWRYRREQSYSPLLLPASNGKGEVRLVPSFRMAVRPSDVTASLGKLGLAILPPSVSLQKAHWRSRETGRKKRVLPSPVGATLHDGKPEANRTKPTPPSSEEGFLKGGALAGRPLLRMPWSHALRPNSKAQLARSPLACRKPSRWEAIGPHS
jgi:hypothetical protein